MNHFHNHIAACRDEQSRLDAAFPAHARRAVGVGALAWLILPALLFAQPKGIEAQVTATPDGIEIDCQASTLRERNCLSAGSSRKILLRKKEDDITCTAEERTAGRCPSTIATDQHFPLRKAVNCTDQDLLEARGRCLYGRGSAVDTFASLPTCNAVEWGHVALVEDEAADYWCNGSEPWTTPAPAPGKWRATMIQCGAGPSHDIWPDGGALPSVNTVNELPTCGATYNNVRVWIGASNHNYPHATGTKYRCWDQTPYAWGENVPAYRETVTDANINTVCRSWQNAGRSWNSSDPFWISPLWTVAGDSWLHLQLRDGFQRWIEFLMTGWVGEGQDRAEHQRDQPTGD